MSDLTNTAEADWEEICAARFQKRKSFSRKLEAVKAANYIDVYGGVFRGFVQLSTYKAFVNYSLSTSFISFPFVPAAMSHLFMYLLK